MLIGCRGDNRGGAPHRAFLRYDHLLDTADTDVCSERWRAFIFLSVGYAALCSEGHSASSISSIQVASFGQQRSQKPMMSPDIDWALPLIFVHVMSPLIVSTLP